MSKSRYISKFWYLWLWLECLGGVACQLTITSEQPTPPTIALSPSPQATTEISTRIMTASPTISPDTITPTIVVVPPTATIEPPLTIVPTATMSPWQLRRSGDFLIFEGGMLDENNNQLVAIYSSQPGATSVFLGEGKLIPGQSLSPDGTKLVFDPDGSTLSYELRPNQLSLANLETGEVTLIHFLKRPSEIFWTSDSQSFIYTRNKASGGVQVMSYNIVSEEEVVLTQFEKASDETWLTGGFSYDGQLFAFIIEANGQYDVYILDMTTLLLQRVTNTPEVEIEAIWSPTARQLLVRVNQQGERWAFNHPPFISQTLVVVNETGENMMVLGSDFEVSVATWSADGQKIAYVDTDMLCLMEIATLEEQCPLQDAPFAEQYQVTGDSPLAWSWDNNWLAFYALPKEGYPCPQLFYLDIPVETVVESEERTCGAFAIYWSE